VKSALDVVNALAWPLVVVLALILFRRPLIELLGEFIRRARKVSVYHVSIELATVPALSPSWARPEIDVRQVSSAHLIDSFTKTLFEELSRPAPADCAIVDLGSGREWLSSRLFLFALVLGEVTGVRAFMFLEKSSSTRKAFLGVASPNAVWKALAAQHPWFEKAFGRATALYGNAMFPTSNSGTLNHIATNYVDALQTIVAPIGLYARKARSVAEIADGASIGIPNDPSNGERALLLLQAQNLIKLKDGVGLLPTVLDVVDNPKKLRLRQIDVAQLPRSLDDIDAAVINTNYAVPAGLIPGKDSIAIESPVNNPYNNFIAVRDRDKEAPWVGKLVRAYQNDTIRQLIRDKLPGQIPAF
jgi:NlpA lipoprotein